MNNFLTVFQNKFVSAGSFLAIIITYLSIAGHLKHSFAFLKKILSKKHKEQSLIVNKIVEWFNYIDINLDNDSFNISYINSLEKDIDFRFSRIKTKKYTLKFNKKFQGRVLNYYGIKKEFHNEDMFKKFSRLNYEYIQIILALSNNIHKSKYSVSNILFVDYWNILRGNFYKFYGQYKNDWKNVKSNEIKFVMTDFENPVMILKLYYNVN